MLVAAVVVADRLPTGPELLVVHEWGAFTSLEDENGRGLPILYGNDEPLPDFVHEISGGWCEGPAATGIADPLVTMGLETPVIYFYPAASQDVLRLDVEVDFPGGFAEPVLSRRRGRSARDPGNGGATRLARSFDWRRGPRPVHQLEGLERASCR